MEDVTQKQIKDLTRKLEESNLKREILAEEVRDIKFRLNLTEGETKDLKNKNKFINQKISNLDHDLFCTNLELEDHIRKQKWGLLDTIDDEED